MQKTNALKPIHYLILFGFTLFAFFYGFGSFAVEDMNEGLYAEIAREMLEMHNFIIPHLNYVPYLEKPPMLYWLIALSYKIFGISAFAARLIPAAAATVICLTCAYFAKELGKIRAGWIAALVLTSSIGFILIARVIIFDVLLTLWLTCAMMCFYLWYIKEKKHFLWFSYAFLGLGFMTKGLVVLVLAFGIAIVFMLVVKTPWKKMLSLLNLVGISLLLLIVIPWVVAATLKQPGFAWDFFINEQVLRFLNERIPHDYHTGPIYYYIPRIFIYIFPWSLMLPSLFVRAPQRNPADKQLKIFLWIWFLIPLLFYSLSRAKGDYYMILGMPPLVLLLGIKFDGLITNNKTRWSSIIFACLAVFMILAVVVILLGNKTWLLLPEPLIQPLVWVGVGLLIYTFVGGFISYYWPNPIRTMILIAGMIMPLVWFYVQDKQYEQPARSQKAAADWVNQQHQNWQVYLYQDYEEYSSLTYYLRKRIVIVDSQSRDLYFGSHTSAARGWFVDVPTFIKLAQSKPLYVVLAEKKIQAFEHSVMPIKFCVLTKTEKLVVMTQCRSNKK